MNISDDKAAKFGTKTFWLGVMLLIIMALYQCMRDVIDDLHHTSPSAPKGVHGKTGIGFPRRSCLLKAQNGSKNLSAGNGKRKKC